MTHGFQQQSALGFNIPKSVPLPQHGLKAIEKPPEAKPPRALKPRPSHG